MIGLPRPVRLLLACAAAVAFTGMAAPSSSAATLPNATPATATVVTSLPHVDFAADNWESQASTDAATAMVSSRCSGGLPAYGTAWYSYTTPSATTVLAENVRQWETSGTPMAAIVSGDLSTVLACTTANAPDGLRTAPVSLAAGTRVYVVRYVTGWAFDSGSTSTDLVITQTTGQPPVNDEQSDRIVIPGVGQPVTFDTTMASTPVTWDCDDGYDNPARDVWWQFTPSTSAVYRFTLSGISPSYRPSLGVFVAGSEDGRCVNGLYERDATLQAGTEYWIQIHGWRGKYDQTLPSGGQGTLTIGIADATPPVWTKLPTTSVPLDSVLTTTPSPCRAGVYNSSLPVAVDYLAADPQSGVASYRLWGNQNLDLGTATRRLGAAFEDENACGGMNQARSFVAVNGFGYQSTNAQWPADRLAVVEDTNLTYSGTWSSSSCTCWSAGTVRRTTRSGAAATLVVPGLMYNDRGVLVNDTSYSLGLVMAKGPDRGKANIYLDGVKVATIDTYAAASVNRTVVWRQSVSAGSHILRVVNAATSGRPRIDIDAVVLVRK